MSLSGSVHPRRALFDPYGERFGFACGTMLTIGAATTFAAARSGIVGGMTTEDLVMLRFGIAGLIFLPLLIRLGLPNLAGIGGRRGLILLLLGGPLFAQLQLGGYAFAPLAHGAVIAPSSVTILSTLMAGLFLRERLTAPHIAGAALVVAGILLLGWEGLTQGTTHGTTRGLTHATGGRAWIGDLMFFASAVIWAGFTVLLRYWRLDAIRAIAVVSVLSMAIMIPGYGAVRGFEHLWALPAGTLVSQGLVQGVLQGVIGLTGYSHAIRVLGVSRAVLFPAAVPAVSVLIGIPITGEWPDAVQISGLLIVSLGLLTAMGVFRFPRRRQPELI